MHITVYFDYPAYVSISRYLLFKLEYFFAKENIFAAAIILIVTQIFHNPLNFPAAFPRSMYVVIVGTGVKTPCLSNRLGV